MVGLLALGLVLHQAGLSPRNNFETSLYGVIDGMDEQHRKAFWSGEVPDGVTLI